MTNRRLIAISEEEVARLRTLEVDFDALAQLSEGAPGSVPGSPAYWNATNDLARSLASRFEDGITEEEARELSTKQGGWRIPAAQRGLDKLRSMFSPEEET